MRPILEGRTLAVINDLSLDEIVWLHGKTRELKEARERKDAPALARFRIDDLFYGLYEVFLEDSTRTKESFKNAAAFHGIKHQLLDVGSSSINKNESYADTFRTLIGYDNQVFVVRSKLEGVCRWLQQVGEEYAAFHGLGFVPVFLNAGDGKHEHPTQELLDEFTLLEDQSWDRSHLHVALVGDLLNGRTVHSKADGLRIFKEVKVDLVAPSDLAMPTAYVERMRENGFEVRLFESIQEYLACDDKAARWYFTRDQLERMPDEMKSKVARLREMTKFKEEYASRLAYGTRFYHPLPMNKEWPEIPVSLGRTPLNGWERQSHNGYLKRIVLLAAVAGKIGHDFDGESFTSPTFDYSFVKEVAAGGTPKDYSKEEDSEGIKEIRDGIVLDKICVDEPKRAITAYVNRVVRIMGFDDMTHFSGPTNSKKTGKTKGYISIPNHAPLSPESSEVHKLAALALGCTVNVIKDGRVVTKIRLSQPPRIYDFDELACPNEACISHPDNHEGIKAEFLRRGEGFDCKYCDTHHSYQQLWRR
ncbi:MAG: aspartate carbamoyltransferase [Candidatus Woesearchaeota archaeon]